MPDALESRSCWRACSSAPAAPGGGHGTAGGRLQVVAAENFWGSITRAARGRSGRGDEHHHEPRHRSARLRGDTAGRAGGGVGRLRDRQRHRVRHVGAEAARRRPELGPHGARRRQARRRQGRRQPAPVVLTGQRREVRRAVTRRSRPARSGRRLVLRAAPQPTRRPGSPSTTPSSRRSGSGTRARRSELRRASSSPLVAALGLTMKTPESFLDAIAEGNEPTAHDTAIVNQQIADHAIKVFVFNRQNATPDVQRLVDAARARHPRRDGHRDARAGRGDVPGLADRRAARLARRAPASHDECRRARRSRCAASRWRSAGAPCGATSTSRSRPASSSRCSGRTGSGSRRC